MNHNDDYDDNNDDGYDGVNNDIAIIGMAGRFPKAENVEQFWANLVSSTDCITRFSREELERMGVSQAALDDPNFVPAAGFIPDQDKFDAHFFEMNPREAANLDPQHRFALEVAWQTLEHAGYTPESVNGSIGVFAGVNMSTYFIFNLLKGDEATSAGDALDTQISVDKDMFASRISYKLNLNGPSIALGTACSTSLVCIHLACQSLLNGESKMALAGGSHIATPNCTGHIYHQGGYSSPDGYCRAFDEKGKGTVGGAGTCFVLLKRMEDALADNDTIYAVIKGSAVNNDGSEKIGYTAPSIVGQTNIIAEAQAVAGVEPDTIRFIEAHGTATELGDPIEFTALTRAFRLQTDKKNFCGIGSVKTNIGHLGMAAGAASVIKASLALKNKVIPESLNFEKPNPKLDIENSPFYVIDKLERIEEGEHPARAGVSSLGIGGTNAHIVLEEPPETESSESRPWQLLVLSAKTPAALDRMTDNLADWMKHADSEKLADAAYTLQVGRKPFAFRRAFVLQDDMPPRLAGQVAPAKGITGRASDKPRKVVFMFPGGGTQHVDMARDLYEQEPAFRASMDECAALFRRKIGLDLVGLIYPDAAQAEANAATLQKPKNFFGALFAVEYSLARLWMSWGVKPDALIGHSLGEYIAACIAGVFSLEDAVSLICCRGALFEKIEKGSMLSVTLPAEEVQQLLIDGVSIATINDPGRCVVAGRIGPMQEFEEILSKREIEYKKLLIDTAGHSPMVDPILQEFGQFLPTIKFGKPAIPFISNMSGGWADPAEIATAAYWKNHLRQPVRFSDGVATLLKDDNSVFLEVGPGNALCSFVRSQLQPNSQSVLLNSLRHVKEEKDDQFHLLETMGKLWLAGVTPDWKAFHGEEQRKRIALPTYPFERKRYWVENRKHAPQAGAKLPVGEWFWQPSWRLQDLPFDTTENVGASTVLAFVDSKGTGAAALELLRQQGARVVSVTQGDGFGEISGQPGSQAYRIDPANAEDYRRLLEQLQARQQLPQVVLHCWSLEQRSDASDDTARMTDSHLSFVYLAQAIDTCQINVTLPILALTVNREAVLANDEVDCSQALITGPARVIPYEFPNIRFTTFDLQSGGNSLMDTSAAAQAIAAELQRLIAQLEQAGNGASESVALRNGLRFILDYIPLATAKPAAEDLPIREQGVYIVTGGLGGVGMVHSQALAARQARLVLLQRAAFPAESLWDALLADEAADALIKEQVRGIRSLQAAGAQVLLLQADVNDAVQVQAALAQARARFGRIDGLVHCAGYGEFVPIRETSRDIIEAVLAPKVRGTKNLLAALEEDQLELVVLCSSMSVATTGYGLVGYVSACAWLDALAQSQRRNKGKDGKAATRFVSIDWDIWSTPQQLARAQGDAALLQRLQENKNAILPREGIEVIHRVLAAGQSQAIISTVDFHQLRRKNSTLGEALIKDSDVSDDVETAASSGSLELYERPSLSTEYVAPSTPEEKLLASIWQETLGIGKIGVNDNFFELGGESLLGVKIVVKAKKMGLLIDPKQMFTTPTIAQVAQFLKKAEAAKAAGAGNDAANESDAATEQMQQARPAAALDAALLAKHGIDPQQVDASYGLTALQTEIYRRFRAGKHGNIVQALSVMEGPLDRGLLEKAWQALVARHQPLRSRFLEDANGAPVQVVCRHADFAVTALDYSQLDPAAQQKALQELMARDRTTYYDLAQAPALRLYHVILSPHAMRFAVLLSQHQIILDGWTSSMLSADLMACLFAIGSGAELPPPPHGTNFGRYLDWLAAQPTALDEAHWRKVFNAYRHADPLQQLMSPQPLLAEGEDAYGEQQFTLDPTTLQHVQECARATRTTANAIYQAAWALSLAQLGHSRDIVYGVTVHGRTADYEGISEVIGQCTNSLPVRMQVTPAASVAELLLAVHEANANAQAHSGLPLARLAALASEAGAGQDIAPEELYSSNFIFENIPRAQSGEAALPIRAVASTWADGWHFPLRVFVVPEEQTWVRLAFDRKRFSEEDVARIAGRYHRNLIAIVTGYEKQLAKFLGE
ncbi:acyl transferase domain-containing protein [Paucimonas lemoignei]|uniref:Phenolphthiocerol/phthiocerol polyketide synthase subunit E n=1 Tax=Paucimonas lemoignei TaxID=29443 RepID=A0A4R3I1I9_PAULE|nr:type I polyketide synthase [Paucimonas lemoignei]TCS39448.1 acyl transferase domain-containing protein [Paucimonas lemoignei]